VGGLNKKDPRDLMKLVRALVGMLTMSGSEPDPRLVNTTAPDLDA
jgi:hypothetical protein